jgi:hypothetical protein
MPKPAVIAPWIRAYLEQNPFATATEVVAAGEREGLRFKAGYVYVVKAAMGGRRRSKEEDAAPARRRTAPSSGELGDQIAHIQAQLDKVAIYEQALRKIIAVAEGLTTRPPF